MAVTLREAPALLAAALLLLALAGAALAAEIDSAASRVGFSLSTRWGQALQGRFPTLQGWVDDLGQQRRRVRLVLSARDVEIVGHTGYTRYTRGRAFFDAERWPQVEFLSDAYGPDLLRTGGALGGVLRMRGVQHRQVFQVLPAECDAPGRDCDVVATGVVDRDDYGMGGWRIALDDAVRFTLRVRLRAEPPA
ncbi:MAG: YceI family protein [Luteimonas sp.]